MTIYFIYVATSIRVQKYFLTIDVSHSFKNNRCCRPRVNQPRLLFDKYLSNSYTIKITLQIYKIEITFD